MRCDEPDLRWAARSVTPYLPELVGPERARQLARLLAEARDDDRIVELAGDEAALAEWLADYLHAHTSTDRDYTGPVGDARPVKPSARFRCPQGSLVWYRRFVGDLPPRCPVHDVDLVRVRDDDGAT